MQRGVVIIGIGEIGAVFARGFLKLGLPVYPVVRGTDMTQAAQTWPLPALVVVATGESDLTPALQGLPEIWRDRAVLIQNELLPRDWEPHQLSHPTIASIWFEKKKGQDVKVLLSSPVWGPHAGLVVSALEKVGIPAREVEDANSMLFELVRKNVYILTTNICGLSCGGDVTGLWAAHRSLAETVAHEIMDIQTFLTGWRMDRVRMLEGLVEGIEGDPRHACQGRSAPSRLSRMLETADRAGLPVPASRKIYLECVSPGRFS